MGSSFMLILKKKDLNPELAQKLEADVSYVARILKLRTLAPDIIETIINGEEPDGLSLTKRNKSFPEEWQEQQQHFVVDIFSALLMLLLGLFPFHHLFFHNHLAQSHLSLLLFQRLGIKNQ